MALNKVMLIGLVGSIEVKTFDGNNGTRKCATFSLATNEKYKDRNGQLIENTEWHNIVSWNHAELCDKYVQKGSPLYVEGKLRTRTWEDKQGNKRYTTEILAESIQLLGKKNDSQSNQQTQQTPTQQQRPKSMPIPPAGEPDDGDLPF